MSQEEVAVAEAPEDADAGQSAIAGGLDVNIAVADVDGCITGTVLLITVALRRRIRRTVPMILK